MRTDPPADPPEETPADSTPHADDGLDLARSVTRATAATGGAAPRRPGRPDAARPRVRRRGGRGALSGAGPDERDPTLVGDAVARLVSAEGWTVDLKVSAVFARWAELVGADVAAHSAPESFADGRLVVRTDATAWATQLTLLAPAIVRRLNEELGHGTVTVLDIHGPRAPSWSKGRRSIRGSRGPRDTYG